MRIYLTIIILISLFSIEGYTQNDMFISQYEISETLSDRAWSLDAFDDGFILATGSLCQGDTSIQSCFNIIRTDLQGNELWQTHIFGMRQGSNNSMRRLSDGNFIVAGDKYVGNNNWEVFILKLDDNGNVLWHRFYDSDHLHYTRDIKELSNGDLIVQADGGPPDNQVDTRKALLKTDSEGDIIWLKEYADTFVFSQLGNLEILSTGEMLMSYEGRPDGENFPNLSLKKLDSEGEVIWDKSIHFDMADQVKYQIKELNNGNYIAITSKTVPTNPAGYIAFVLVEMDTSGNIINEVIISDGTVNNFIMDIELTVDGSIILVGKFYIDSPETGNGDWIPWLLKYDEDLNQIWERFMVDENHVFNGHFDVEDMEIMFDGRIALSLRMKPIDPNYPKSAIPTLMVLDSTGCYIENCTEDIQLIITDIEDIISNSKDILISPNPTSGIFRIEIPSDLIYSSLSFYDISGRQLFHRKTKLDILEQDISHFSNGIYFMTLEDEYGQIISRKKVVVSK